MTKFYKFQSTHQLLSGITKRTNTIGFCDEAVAAIAAEFRIMFSNSFVQHRTIYVQINNLPIKSDIKDFITDNGLQKYFYRELYTVIKTSMIEFLSIDELAIDIQFDYGIAVATLPIKPLPTDIIQLHKQIQLHH